MCSDYDQDEINYQYHLDQEFDAEEFDEQWPFDIGTDDIQGCPDAIDKETKRRDEHVDRRQFVRDWVPAAMRIIAPDFEPVPIKLLAQKVTELSGVKTTGRDLMSPLKQMTGSFEIFIPEDKTKNNYVIMDCLLY